MAALLCGVDAKRIETPIAPSAIRPLRTPGWLERSAQLGWRVLVVGATLYFGALALHHVRAIVLPVALALFLTALAYPLVGSLAKRGVPRWVSAFATMVVFVGVLAGGITLFTWGMTNEASSFGTSLYDGWLKATQRLGEALPSLDGAGVRQWSRDAFDEVGSSFSEVLRGVRTVATVGSQGAIAVVLAFFFLKDGPRLSEGILEWVPERRRPLVTRLTKCSWDTVAAYMRGVAIVACFNSVLTGIAMWAIGVPLVGAVMVVTFIGSFVPFAGPAIAIGLSSLVALANGGPMDAALMIAAGMGIQALEGNVLQPYVVGRSVSLHPAAVIVAVAVGAAVGGLPGAFFAVPIAASGWAAVNQLSRAHEESAAE